MDHAGPLYCSDAPKCKFYVLLFTCAVVRAVHLELVDSLSLSDCMLAVRRFVARRGLPSVIYSDNAKTFKAAQASLLRQYGHLSPHWKFIVPRSPWWGGWWERLVRSVKTALRRTLGSHSLTRCELEAVLHEVESCINSRPLTFVGDDLDSEDPLTPAHFLMRRPAGVQGGDYGGGPYQVSARDLVSRKVVSDALLEQFCVVWSSEYVRQLPPWRGSGTKGELTVGSVVLVREDGYSRMQWPMGVVTKVFPGRDGLVRAVEVKTAKCAITRSIQRLHSLEIATAGGDSQGKGAVPCTDGEVQQGAESLGTLQRHTSPRSPCAQGSQSGVQVTRKGRKIKPVDRLDL